MAVKLTHLQLNYGAAGARDKFEDLAVHLIRSERPDAERVRIVRGDGGIDAHDGSLADPAGVDVFQVKFFPAGIGDSQKSQIRDSFNTARDSRKFKAKSWTLCVPIDLSIDEKEWFDGWKHRQSASGIKILRPWDATKLEGLLYDPKNRGIKEEFFKEEYLQQIRETHGTVEKFAREFEQRVPKPLQLVLETRFQGLHVTKVHDFDDQRIVIEVGFVFHVHNPHPQTVNTWHVVTDIVCPDVSRIVDKKLFPKLSEHRNNPFDTAILPTLHKEAIVHIGVVANRSWPAGRQLAGLLPEITMTCRTISDNHDGENQPVYIMEKVNLMQLSEELAAAVVSSGVRCFL
jgi:hypothetical protein